MDLSTLPLMPSMDLPPPVEVLVPTAQRPSFDTPTKRLPEREVLDGCFCPSCQEQRERDRTAAPPTPWIDTVSMSAQYDGDIYAAVAGAFSGAVTGRISAAQPVQSSRIRGRYTEDRNANANMAGEARWLEPSAGALYGTVAERFASNSGLSQRGDGTWISPSGMVWEVL